MTPKRRTRRTARGTNGSPRGNARTAQGAPSPDFVVGPDMVVKVAYRLFDEDGTLFDTVPTASPLKYVHGYAQVIPGLELGLEGARSGERRSLVLDPEEAFGERDPDALLEIDRNDFPSAEQARVGDELLCTAPDGSECAYRIVEIGETDIVADRNHPLAGRRVRFEVDVVSVRPAAEEVLKRAEAEMDERIVYADSIGYDTNPDDGTAGPPPHEAPLVQLRVNPRSGSTS